MNSVDLFINKHPIKKIKVGRSVGEYIVGGKGKTGFVVLPGAGQNLMSCFDLVGAFEKDYKTVVVNIQGFYDMETFFTYINDVLKTEKIDKIILYGLSLGGFLAQHYAIRNKARIKKLILSHTATTKSPAIIKNLIRPGKVAYVFLPIVPLSLFHFLARKFAGRMQVGSSNISKLYDKYSSRKNMERRMEIYSRFGFEFITKDYLKSLYELTTDMEKEEQNWGNDLLKGWSKNILILRTDNDPLVGNEGFFKLYYPNAKIYTFHETGHLTPFIQFKQMKKIIDSSIV